jgi:TolB-like protein/Tfp pilus assembly protein PilF
VRVAEGAGDASGGATGVQPGALTALLQEVAAAPEKSEEEPLSLPPGTILGRFEIIRELGRGGFGVVYVAKDRDLGRQVAVKVVRPGRITEEEGRVSREAEAVARLSHPNLITLFEVGRSDHGPFLVFELLRGKTLDLRMEEGPVPVQEAVHIATEVARGLAHAHAEGVIHRDLKPANVFITNKGQVKILDFGMAHAFGRRRLSGGTPAYMAPEQWEDDPEDERTDVFALGVMLYRMLTGEYPFPEGKGRWSSEPATPRKLDVPGAQDLAELVEKMLDRTPKGRPRDGAAVLAALAPIEDKLRAKPADGTPPVHAKRRKATFGDLLAELKRRHVFRVMVGYGIFAFAVLQVTEPIMHGAELPDWVLKAVLIALVLGFPVAVVLAWVYDLTAHGVKRTPSPSGPAAPSFGRSRLLIPLAVSTAVLVLAAVGAGAWYAWRRGGEHRQEAGTAGGQPSVAVLSFADLSPGHDQEYLGDGVAEEVLNRLAQVDGLRVIGRSTSFSFKGKGKKVEEIGKELGVGSVLEGSVRRSGDKVRITAQLVRARDASTLWSRSFERSLNDVFAVQEEIGRAVVEALAVRLLPVPHAPRSGPRPANGEAYDLFLLGRYMNERGPADKGQSIPVLERSIALDPNYAPAHAMLFFALRQLDQTPDVRHRRKVAAERAVELDPLSPAAHAARAAQRSWDGNEAGALEDVERSLELGPSDAIANMFAGVFWAQRGRLDEAVARARQATQIDPLDMLGWLNLGTFLTYAGNLDEARSALRRALQLIPEEKSTHCLLADVDLLAGAIGAALEGYGRCPVDNYRLAGISMAHHSAGRKAESDSALAELERPGKAVTRIAFVHAWRGEKDQAFEWLERLGEGAAMRSNLRAQPFLRGLRDDPRFPALLKKLGAPPSH